jgi:hypothetical protein
MVRYDHLCAVFCAERRKLHTYNMEYRSAEGKNADRARAVNFTTYTLAQALRAENRTPTEIKYRSAEGSI